MISPTYVASLQTADPLQPAIVVLDGLLLGADDADRRAEAAAVLASSVRDPMGTVLATEIAVDADDVNVDLRVAVASSVDVDAAEIEAAVRVVTDAAGATVSNEAVRNAVARMLDGRGTVETTFAQPDSTSISLLQRIVRTLRSAWFNLFGRRNVP